MRHPIYRVLSFIQTGPYELKVTFDDGLSRTIDFFPVLRGALFGPLRDPESFARVTLDPEVQTLVWANGADFDPATLHDWDHHRAAFEAMASRWETYVPPAAEQIGDADGAGGRGRAR